MALFKKAKGRLVRYSVKFFTKIVPPETLQEWKGIMNYSGEGKGNGHAAIPHNLQTKTEKFLSLYVLLYLPCRRVESSEYN